MHIAAVGGGDAGISAAPREREVDPRVALTVVAADACPNFSTRGIPYYVSDEVPRWCNLAHRAIGDLEATSAVPVRPPVASLDETETEGLPDA